VFGAILFFLAILRIILHGMRSILRGENAQAG
jgi:hypothetical protein